MHPLPPPLGEVDERSEDGEGIPGCNTLSVTFGDSSPRGRAKGVYPDTKMECIGIDTLHPLFYDRTSNRRRSALGVPPVFFFRKQELRQPPMSSTATSLTLVPVGPVTIRPPDASSA